MKQTSFIILIVCCVLILTGCWDQLNMKDAVLIRAISFDKADEGKLQLGLMIRTFGNSKGDASQAKGSSDVLSTEGYTPRDARIKLNRAIPGNLDPSKNKLILFGESFAKDDIYPPLDVIWRDPRSSLSAKIVVVKGKAHDVLSLHPQSNSDISQSILNLISSNEVTTNIPKQSIQSLASEILDPGEDVVLPLISFSKKKDSLEISGLALFDDRVRAGTLSSDESTLFLLLRDKKGDEARFTKKVSNDEEYNINNYITLNIEKTKRTLKVRVNKSGDIFVDLDLAINFFVEEYPKGDVLKEEKKLNKKLSELLTKDAEQVVKKLQDSNCDAFGIGRYLIAHHHKIWTEMNDKAYFQKVQFNTKVDARIVQQGIVK